MLSPYGSINSGVQRFASRWQLGVLPSGITPAKLKTPMTKVQLLEREIKKLDRSSLEAFRNWFQHYDSDAWDLQIRRDARAGKLEKLSQEALAEHKSGKTRKL